MSEPPISENPSYEHFREQFGGMEDLLALLGPPVSSTENWQALPRCSRN